MRLCFRGLLCVYALLFCILHRCLSIGWNDDSSLVFEADALRVDHELVVVKRKPERAFNLEAQKDLTCV